MQNGEQSPQSSSGGVSLGRLNDLSFCVETDSLKSPKQ